MVNRPIRKSKVQKRVNKTQSLKKRAGKKQRKQSKQGKQGKQGKQSKQRARVYRKKSKRGGMKPPKGILKYPPPSRFSLENLKRALRRPPRSAPQIAPPEKKSVTFATVLNDNQPFNIKVYQKENEYLVPLIHNDSSHNSSTGISFYNLNNENVEQYSELKLLPSSGTVLLENDRKTITVKIIFKDGEIQNEFELKNKNIMCQLDLTLGGSEQQKIKKTECAKEAARQAEAAPQAAPQAEETEFGF